ncbi:hypothetical protein M0Q50_10605 [bacterium]|jgi:hypothetical protein|nr:hypothetical protein [bacterium]
MEISGKTESINAKYEYKGEGELIKDMPSKPLVKKKYTQKSSPKSKNLDNIVSASVTVKVKDVPKIIQPIEVKQESKKDLYNKLIDTKESFVLKYLGDTIFDSSIDKIDKLDFQDTQVFCKGNIISYAGLSLKFKK